MSTQDLQDTQFRAALKGLCLTRPADLVPPGKYPYLKNIRSYVDGEIRARAGLIATLDPAISGQTYLHSVRRLNDDVSFLGWTRVMGAGTKLYTGTITATERDTGYSGNPLALVPYRPEQSPKPFMYIGDSSRMRKIDQAGNDYPIGYPRPTSTPSIALTLSSTANSNPAYPNASIPHTFIELSANSEETATDWILDGGSDSLVLRSAGNGRVNTTITAILYDSGTSGWACIFPDSISGIQRGARLYVASAEYILVHSVHQGAANTAIDSIVYDSGSTGLCTIQLTNSPDYLTRDAMIQNSTVGSEYVRVLSVTRSPDGSHSIRCLTTGTWAIGNTIVIPASFRASTVVTRAAANTLVDSYLRFTRTYAATSGAETHHMSKAIVIDLSMVAGERPTAADDLFHVSLRVNNLANLIEGRIMLDADSAAADLSGSWSGRNHYYRAFRAPDFTAAIRQATTVLAARQTAITRDLIDWTEGQDETAPLAESSDELGLGDSQWIELTFRVADLTRVGTDESRTLRNVGAVRFSITTSATTIIDVDSFWLGGGYEPDMTATGNPYLYRYRGRDSSTGAKSGYSPAVRSGLEPTRQRVTITLAGLLAATWPNVDKLDIERFGGEIADWHYLGTVTNDTTGANVTFVDEIGDLSAAVSPLGDADHFQPWPSVDIPRSGTGYAAGTAFVRSTGDNFDSRWPPGVVININGTNYALSGSPVTASLLHLTESAGTVGSAGSPVAWTIAEPTLEGMPLYALWGPVDGFMFACGDSRNLGTLYWSKGNDPDGASELNKLELTSPSEPLIAGCAFDGRSYVWSSERMFYIIPRADGQMGYLEVPNGKGLFAPWAFCVGPKIWFLSRDGIYETTGGTPRSITHEDLYPLFPHDGQAADVTVNSIPSPQISSGVRYQLRLAYYDSMLYFDYIDLNSAFYTLVYDTAREYWMFDDYARDIVMHYGDEGSSIHGLFAAGVSSAGNSGMLYSVGGANDDTAVIASQIRLPSFDAGASRALKLWQDNFLDIDRDGATITIVQGFNQHGTTLASQSVTTGSGRQRYQFPASSGAGQSAYNASLDISWSSATAVPKLYGWSFDHLTYPNEQRGKQTLGTTHGLTGYQHHRSAYISLISSGVVTLTINIDGTDYAYTIASTGGAHRKVYLTLQAIKGKVFSYRLAGAATFQHFQWDSEVLVRSWDNPGAYSHINPFGLIDSTGLRGEV